MQPAICDSQDEGGLRQFHSQVAIVEESSPMVCIVAPFSIRHKRSKHVERDESEVENRSE